MILTDRKIKEFVLDGTLGIEPFDLKNIQPSSYDVTLGREILIPKRGTGVADPQDLSWNEYQTANLPYTLYPGEFILGSTVETVRIPRSLVAMLHGRSSYARLGLDIHAAGFIDPGFVGQITLELKNTSSQWAIILRAGSRIGQLSFTTLFGVCDLPYGHALYNSKYQGQTGPTASRLDQGEE